MGLTAVEVGLRAAAVGRIEVEADPRVVEGEVAGLAVVADPRAVAVASGKAPMAAGDSASLQ